MNMGTGIGRKVAAVTAKTLLSIVLLYAGVIACSMLLQLLPEWEGKGNFATPVGLGLSAWLMVVWFERKRELSIGWRDARGAGQGFVGVVSGAMIIGLGALVMLLTNTIDVRLNDWTWQAIAVQTLLFLAVAMGEEWLFRGYLFGLYQQAFSARTAVWVSSAMFTAIHLINPNAMSRPMEHIAIEMVNIMLMAILMARSRLAAGSLWMPIGLHVALNVLQSTVFGFVNGGKEVDSLFRIEYDSLNVWNGASHGLESSLIFTPVLLLAVLVTGWVSKRRRAVGEELIQHA